MRYFRIETPHRNTPMVYTMLLYGDVQIKIFDQQIRFYNPGKLYGSVTIDDLKEDNYTSELRNKLIAEAFYLTKDIEKYGTGFFRIRNEVKNYPTMTFEYHEQGNGFVTSLGYAEQKISTEVKVGEKVGENLSSNQLKIVDAMRANDKVTFSELSHIVGISEISIHRNVRVLRKDNVVKRVGPAKGGHWEVNI
ncbi:ATP-dependent DNA helicase RecG [bacterium A37T11]|nr:ATP-dependent DNA helicase RecG [bacterium A37T11]